MKKICLVGDSHVLMYNALLSPNFEPIHCGACTAYSLMKPNSITGSFNTLQHLYNGTDPKLVRYIFLFGEIDCRTLIYQKHKKENTNLSKIIDIVVDRYFSAIIHCRDNGGYEVAVHGIIPAVQQRNDYNMEFYGNDTIRAEISYKFEESCHWKAIDNNIPFFNCTFIPGMRNEHGMVPKSSLLPDLVHVDPGKVSVTIYFKKWLQELGWWDAPEVGNETQI